MSDIWPDLISEMKQRGINFAARLSDQEFEATESQFGFHFPPDLRAFLQTALPQGQRFPNWRSGDEAGLWEWFDLPRRGILFDIEHSGFWLAEWGKRPEALAEAKKLASDLVAAASTLIPIYAHRMVSEEPRLANPVLSVHQTDNIYYGFDLADYLRHEFELRGREPWPAELRQIPFWTLVVS
jgi:hypothetical protein